MSLYQVEVAENVYKRDNKIEEYLLPPSAAEVSSLNQDPHEHGQPMGEERYDDPY